MWDQVYKTGVGGGKRASRVRGDSRLDEKIPPLVLKANKTVRMFQGDTSWAMECQENTKA